MNQYLHQFSNTKLGTPADFWFPSNDRIAPKRSDQIAVGIARDFPNSKFSVSVEAYYKYISNEIGNREGYSFLNLEQINIFNSSNWTEYLVQGKSRAYGAEFLLQKNKGRLNGWIGYTLAWNKNHFPLHNLGEPYPGNTDRRHNISVVGFYEISPKTKFSLAWVYNSAPPLDLPSLKYVSYSTNGSRPVKKEIFSTNGSAMFCAVYLIIALILVLSFSSAKKSRTQMGYWNI